MVFRCSRPWNVAPGGKSGIGTDCGDAETCLESPASPPVVFEPMLVAPVEADETWRIDMEPELVMLGGPPMSPKPVALPTDPLPDEFALPVTAPLLAAASCCPWLAALTAFMNGNLECFRACTPSR